jgi:hypothetical protein
MIPFLLFTAFFAAFFYLHFAFAHRAWLALRGQISSELNMAYVRIEDYFGLSFRSLLENWLRLPSSPESTPGLRVVDRGHERIFVAGSAAYPDMRRESEVLVIQGHFSCGSRCDFRRELYVRESCEIGPYSRLQALAVDGDLTLGYGTEVRRWVDATGHLTIEEECIVRAKATSRTGILLGSRARAKALFAPEIASEGRVESSSSRNVVPPMTLVLPLPPGAPVPPAHTGFDASRFHILGGQTYFYDGHLVLTLPLHLKASLVVRGDFSCTRESLLEANLKAKGHVDIGADSTVQANIVAEKDIYLGQGSIFQGILLARGSIRLARGVRGLPQESPVSACSTGPLLLESNVVVKGKLASADRVEAVPTPVAWLDRQYPLRG